MRLISRLIGTQSRYLTSSFSRVFEHKAITVWSNYESMDTRYGPIEMDVIGTQTSRPAMKAETYLAICMNPLDSRI